MPAGEALMVSDPALVARYLVLRSYFHDEILPAVDRLVRDRYRVEPPARPVAPTLVALVRAGYNRPGEGDVWPVVFLTPIDITMALAVQLTPERLTRLGTTVNGPQRIRHRYWEDWWGWDSRLADVRPGFFNLSGTAQDEAILAWYAEHLEWLAGMGLMARR